MALANAKPRLGTPNRAKNKDTVGTKFMAPAHTGAIVISEFEAQDIDNEVDWALAELKYSELYE